MSAQPNTWTVERADAGRTLQDVLADRLQVSRRKAKDLIDSRCVFVNGRRTWMARHALRAGDRIEAGGARPAAGRA